MTRARLLLVMLAIIACASVAAGCGGVSKADYEKDVAKIGGSVEKELDKLDSETPTPESLAAAVTALETAAGELEDTTPPSEVEKLHSEFISVLNDTAKLLSSMAPLMEKATRDPQSMGEKDIASMQKITKDFAKIETRMKKVEQGYVDKKYDVGLGDGK